MDLDNRIWHTLQGGYKMVYDASRPLKKLKAAARQDELKLVFDELWENLHHQGDVGTASYLAVPHLVEICIEKKSLDWNFIGLCLRIENGRLEEDNPELPDEFQDYYFEALSRLENYLLLNFKNITDQTGIRLTLALLATVNGQPKLGKAIELMDENELPSFLENF